MKLLSWNVAGRVRRLSDQIEAVRRAEPDVVALQEVTRTTAPAWTQSLREALPHVVCALDRDGGGRRHAVLVASRWPLEPVTPSLPVPWPESLVAVHLAAPGGPLELHAVHVPNARNGWIKVETLEALYARWVELRAADPPRRLVVCGDLNTPRRELADGTIVSFARDRYGVLRPERGARWDAAERAPFVQARDLGIHDCFRTCHGFARREPSWTWPRWPQSGYRLDHVLASEELTPRRCEYLHELRTERLSDHSAIEAELTIGQVSSSSPARPRRP